MKFIALLLSTFLCTSGLAQESLSRADVAALNEQAYQIYTADFARADSIFQRTSQVAAENNWAAEEAAARKNLGIVRFLAGDYDAALPEYQAALSQFEDLGDEVGQASVLVEMGNFFLKRKDQARAGELLDRAARLARAGGDDVLYGNARDIRAMMDLRAGNLDAAGEALFEVLALRRRIQDTVGLSYVYDHIASLKANQGAPAAALVYLDSTIQIRELLGDRQGMAIAVNNQGETLLVAGDTARAIPYLERSLGMSTAVGFTDLRQWTMGLLSQSYAAVGQPARALAMQRSVQGLKDSLYDVATSAQIAEMQEKYESVKREAELATRGEQLARRTTYLVLALLLATLLVGLLFYRAQRQKQRRLELQRQAEAALRDDRLRISRDLHDHLGAELMLVASNLNRLNHQLPEAPLEPVTKQVRYAIEQMRETIWAVRLDAATWSDLFARLRGFGDKLPHDGIRFELDPALADVALTPHEVLNLFRFGQEALANAVKHARAANIVVSARPGRFSVVDDGVGFDPAAGGGFGMATLRERAVEVGGELFISDDAPGSSVEIEFKIQN